MKDVWYITTAFILGLAVALMVVGCSGITNGEVRSKEFVPEHQETYTTYIKVGEVNVPQHHVRTVPDQWFVTIGKENEDGKWKTRTYQISKQYYDQCQEGDWLDFSD